MASRAPSKRERTRPDALRIPGDALQDLQTSADAEYVDSETRPRPARLSRFDVVYKQVCTGVVDDALPIGLCPASVVFLLLCMLP